MPYETIRVIEIYDFLDENHQIFTPDYILFGVVLPRRVTNSSRYHTYNLYEPNFGTFIEDIHEWCEENLGKHIIIDKPDYGMDIKLYDIEDAVGFKLQWDMVS